MVLGKQVKEVPEQGSSREKNRTRPNIHQASALESNELPLKTQTLIHFFCSNDVKFIGTKRVWDSLSWVFIISKF